MVGEGGEGLAAPLPTPTPSTPPPPPAPLPQPPLPSPPASRPPSPQLFFSSAYLNLVLLSLTLARLSLSLSLSTSLSLSPPPPPTLKSLFQFKEVFDADASHQTLPLFSGLNSGDSSPFLFTLSLLAIFLASLSSILARPPARSLARPALPISLHFFSDWMDVLFLLEKRVCGRW